MHQRNRCQEPEAWRRNLGRDTQPKIVTVEVGKRTSSTLANEICATESTGMSEPAATFGIPFPRKRFGTKLRYFLRPLGCAASHIEQAPRTLH
jgi:hypothetical protein